MQTMVKPIIEQLYDIYKQTPWQNQEIPHDKVISYYQEMLDKNLIYIINIDGELLGYYERWFIEDTCFLVNVYSTSKQVFKQLYRHFFNTMPKNINYVQGEKQKIGGKMVKEVITNARRN